MSFRNALSSYKKRKQEEKEEERNKIVVVDIKDQTTFSSEVVLKSTSLEGDFALIGNKHGTDKVSRHGYQRFYGRYLDPLRQLPSSSMHAMMEIGVDKGCSLQTWLEYFPSFYIYGIDIDANDAPEGDRYLLIQADQSNISAFQKIMESSIKHPLVFIIDDGSHVPEHQISSFDYLFADVLVPGGVYIIEDIETSYWTKGNIYGYRTAYGYHHIKSVIEIFKLLIDDINKEYLLPDHRVQQNLLLTDTTKRMVSIRDQTRGLISSITFGQNCIIILKKTTEEIQLYTDRVYKFRQNL